MSDIGGLVVAPPLVLNFLRGTSIVWLKMRSKYDYFWNTVKK